jgi:hypothetical protein
MYYDIYLYTLYYYICCLLGACIRCTRLCSLKPGVTINQNIVDQESLDDIRYNHSIILRVILELKVLLGEGDWDVGPF